MDQQSRPMPQLTIDNASGNRLSGFSLLVVISTILAVVICGFFYFYNLSLTNQIADLDGQRSALISELQTPDNLKLEEQINGAASAISSISTLSGSGQYKLSKFLDDLPTAMTKDSKFNGLSVDRDGAVKIDGVTVSQTSLAKLIQSFNDAKFLKDVILLSSAVSSESNKPVVAFSLSMSVNSETVAETATTSTP